MLGLVSDSVAKPTALDEVLGLDGVRIIDAVVAALLRYLAADSEERETGELEGYSHHVECFPRWSSPSDPSPHCVKYFR